MAAARADELTPEPRWKRAGPPYLLTREELIAELAARGFATSPRQLQSWVSYGLLPKPARRVPTLAPDRVPRALYPASLIPALEELLGLAHQNQTIAQLKDQAPAIIARWRERVGEGLPGAALIAAGGAGVGGTAVLTLGPFELSAAGTVTPPTPTDPRVRVTKTLGVVWHVRANPPLPRVLQRAVWAYAQQMGEYNQVEIGEATLVLRTKTGEEMPVPIPTPPPPRRRRRTKAGE